MLALREKSRILAIMYSSLYSSVFSLSTGKYRPEKTPHLNIFHAVKAIVDSLLKVWFS